jgi:hypothetical protein
MRGATVTKRAAGLFHGPILWVAVPALAAVTAGSVYVVVDRSGGHTPTQVRGEKFVASGAGTANGAAGASNGNGGVGNGNGNGNVPGNPGKQFRMSGAVSGLAPGKPVQLDVIVDNSANNQALQVTGVSGTVGTPTGAGAPSTGRPACSSAWATVTPYSFKSGMTPIVAPAGGRATVSLTVTFNDSPTINQDTCKGATFPIALSGTGQQA